MQATFSQIMCLAAALAGGATIGLVFGAVQEAAAKKHALQQRNGTFHTAWAAIPGSMRRTAGLLMALALVQLICPLLFKNGCQWWVSGGVVAGYGWSLYQKLRQNLAAARAR